MKKAPYMAYNELKQLMWLSAFSQAMDTIIETTTAPEWTWRMKTIRTHLQKIIDERCFSLDPYL